MVFTPLLSDMKTWSYLSMNNVQELADARGSDTERITGMPVVGLGGLFCQFCWGKARLPRFRCPKSQTSNLG